MNAVSDGGVDQFFGDVYASRRFQLKVTAHGYLLVGVAFKQPIVDGINVSQCGRWDHPSPDPYCTCGFYAFDDAKSRVPTLGVTVDAVVRLSGRTVIADHGVRAERMEIVAVSSSKPQIREKLQSIIKAAVFTSRDAMFDEYPLTKLERTKTTLGSSLKWELKKGFMGVRNFARAYAADFLVGALKTVFVIVLAFFVIRAEVETLPDGYEAHAVLLTALLLGFAYASIKMPWMVTLLLSTGILMSGSEIVTSLRDPLEASGLYEATAINFAAFGVAGIMTLMIRLMTFGSAGSPQVRERLMPDGTMPVAVYLPEDGSKNND